MRTILSLLLLTILAFPVYASLNQAPPNMHYEVRIDQDTLNRYFETIASDLLDSGIKNLEVAFDDSRIVVKGSIKKVTWIGFKLGFKLDIVTANTFKMTCDQFQVLGFVPLKKSWLINGINDAMKKKENEIKAFVSWTKKDDNITLKVTPPNQAILPDLTLNSCYIGNSGLVFWGKYNK